MRECPACFSCYDDSVLVCPVEGRQTFNSLPGDVALDGRYVLEKRLGEGGMGVVYKAHHKFLKKTRAVKIIKPELVGNDPSFSTRFQQEAMTAAAIEHPNIISVPDYGFLDGQIPFLVMEFIEGISLQDLMTSEGRFTPEKALEYMRVIAAGVGAAHAHGIVHRDLKPLNIMIHSKGSPQEQIRILDFGLAKIKSADMFGSFVHAKTTGIIGSPYYMAPEQWSDDEPDKRCDIYSLGIILYQMLSGEVPFKGSSIPAVMKKHLMSPPPPLAVKGSGISEGLEKVVYHALEKDPILRTSSAEELIAELEQAVAANSKGKRSRVRTRPKADASGTRAKDDPARTTGNQEKARAEDKEVARSTGDQKKVLETHESVDVDPLDAELVDDSKANETIVSGAPVVVRIAETSIPSESEVESDNSHSQPGAKTSLAGAQPVQIEDDHLPTGNISGSRSDELRRATEDARRRAEERAIQGLTESAEAKKFRSASMPPTLDQLAPEPSKFDPKTLLRKPFLLVAGAVALIATIVVVLLLVNSSAEPPPIAEDVPAPTRPQRDMVLIKGGGFTMGSETAGQHQKGAHFVNVNSFYMDRTEVTNEQYAEFIKATGYRVPANTVTAATWWIAWNGTDPPKGRERWPVSNVSAKDAEAYAQWLSTRDGVKYQLPSEEQWEFAARNGASETPFPWGETWDDTRANLNGKQSPTAVGSFPTGQTSAGLLDMVGNVWEFTSSRASYYNSRKTVNADEATARVRRGGSFAEKIKEHFFDATDRGWAENEEHKFPSIGFRLVRDAP